MRILKEVIHHMVLPVAVMTLLGVGSLTRYFRSNMIDVIKQDYIRTARAKGLKESKVLFTHALRNALLPAITLVGFELPALFGGSLIIEKILTGRVLDNYICNPSGLTRLSFADGLYDVYCDI